MARMRAIEAAVLVMRREGVDTAFGVPGAAINPMLRESEINQEGKARKLWDIEEGKGI